MHQRDYILRIVEQLGSALAEVRRRILGKGRSAGVRGDLSELAGRAGFDLDLLVGFDLQTLRMLVSPAGDVEPARCWLMAELLYLHGLDAVTAGEFGAHSLLKARALYDLIRPAGGLLVGFPEAAERIAEIDVLLEGGDPDDSECAVGRPRRVSSRRGRARRVRAEGLARGWRAPPAPRVPEAEGVTGAG